VTLFGFVTYTLLVRQQEEHLSCNKQATVIWRTSQPYPLFTQPVFTLSSFSIYSREITRGPA